MKGTLRRITIHGTSQAENGVYYCRCAAPEKTRASFTSEFVIVCVRDMMKRRGIVSVLSRDAPMPEGQADRDYHV